MNWRKFYTLLLVDIMQHEDGGPHFGTDEAFGYEDPNPHASLEDLCRSHLVSIYVSHSLLLRCGICQMLSYVIIFTGL